ncbi:MAG TPA: bifunctional adenosylcobinamide kinase/adenosylcobinamide-phosphate guanylyltransferase [Actinomycetota bacterium]|jgi:adenosyl cobinamide kinase/adenosyl cobinamide phosphate guanylyltransferase|nr:bifunctional adenosylcobinamide kinase/adenosylcobinamide-phosphate guanylyltransferase [Actinomycetota bacterium]
MGLTFLLGGARSGKSRLAVSLASSCGARVTFIATAEGRDHEMSERIDAHRAARPAAWTTLEEPLDLARAVDAIGYDEVVVVDCLSLWVSNAFEAGMTANAIAETARAVAGTLARRSMPVIGVSNEVGLGIVPMHPLGRAYRDALGTVNAVWAAAAERTFLVVAGKVLPLGDAADVMRSR